MRIQSPGSPPSLKRQCCCLVVIFQWIDGQFQADWQGTQHYTHPNSVRQSLKYRGLQKKILPLLNIQHGLHTWTPHKASLWIKVTGLLFVSLLSMSYIHVLPELLFFIPLTLFFAISSFCLARRCGTKPLHWLQELIHQHRGEGRAEEAVQLCQQRFNTCQFALWRSSQHNHLSCVLKINSSLQQMMVLHIGDSLSLMPATAVHLFFVATVSGGLAIWNLFISEVLQEGGSRVLLQEWVELCPHHCCLPICDNLDLRHLSKAKQEVCSCRRISSGHPSQAVTLKWLTVYYLHSPAFLVLVFELLGAELFPMPGKHSSFTHKQIPCLLITVLLPQRIWDRERLRDKSDK